MKRLIAILLTAAFLFTFTACAKGGEEKKETEAPVALKYTCDSAYDDMSQSIKDAYLALCDAVVGYQSELRINVGFLGDIYDLYQTSFPLAFLTKSIQPKEDASGVTIVYNKTEEEHRKTVRQFADKIEAMKAQCFEGTTNTAVYAVRAYHLVATTLSYEQNYDLTLYDTVMNGKGNENTFAKLLEFLFVQADIPSTHIIATASGGAPVYLSAATLGEHTYYFDVFGENAYGKGEGLLFFGLTADEVKAQGFTNLTNCRQGTVPDAVDLKFDACRKAVSWEISGADLLLTTAENDVLKITL